jgi:sterol desaturase/sphingolipid hydroxylase (fatty acid hydroxylase superfamily)
VLAPDATTLKALIAPIALLTLLVAERRAPATASGRAGWAHDARNLALGVLNGCLGIGLALLVLPPFPTPGGGLLGLLGLSGVAAFLGAFLLLDLWMYAWHRLVHAVPILWRVHRMHHSDEALDASSAFRFHPLETTASQVLRVPLAWALGVGAAHVAAYEAVFLPVILLHHSNLRLSERADRLLRLLIVTPALHRTHHSPRPVETNSNYGSVLSVWDRLAGTFGRLAGVGATFGLAGLRCRRWQSLAGLLLTPFRSAGHAGE